MQELEELLPSWMVRQRWYAGKGRVPLLRRIGGLRFQDPAGEVDVDVHLMLDESGQSPTIYQVPLTYRSARLAGADHALVATVEPNSHGRHAVRYVYDAPHDPVFATALLQLMLGEGTTTPGEGAASDEPSSGMASGMAPGSAIGSRQPSRARSSPLTS